MPDKKNKKTTDKPDNSSKHAKPVVKSALKPAPKPTQHGRTTFRAKSRIFRFGGAIT